MLFAGHPASRSSAIVKHYYISTSLSQGWGTRETCDARAKYGHCELAFIFLLFGDDELSQLAIEVRVASLRQRGEHVDIEIDGLI